MIKYLIENSVEIIAIIGGLITVSQLIARLTPTSKDDKVIEKIRKVFEIIATMNIPDNKETKNKK